MSNKVKVTLVRSLIATKPVAQVNAKALGLHRIGDSVIHEKGAVLNGKLATISHLVKVEDIAD